MGTNGFQMEISGTSDDENRPLITQSRKDSRYIGHGFRNCKGFVQLRCAVIEDHDFAMRPWNSDLLDATGWQRGAAPRCLYQDTERIAPAPRLGVPSIA